MIATLRRLIDNSVWRVRRAYSFNAAAQQGPLRRRALVPVEEAPPLGSVIGRHVEIVIARAVAAVAAALHDAEGDGAVEDGRAAVARATGGAGDRHPGGVARAAAQVAGRREIDPLDLGAAIAGALAAVAD